MPWFVRAAAPAAALLLIAVAALPPPASAQGPGNQVCFYEHADFGGRRMCIAIGQRVPDVGLGFNDMFSSATVPPGVRATMCEDINFGGRCTRLDRTVPNFQALGAWNDIVSSVAAEPIGPPAPGYGGPPPGPGYGGPGFGRRDYDRDRPGRGPDDRGPPPDRDLAPCRRRRHRPVHAPVVCHLLRRHHCQAHADRAVRLRVARPPVAIRCASTSTPTSLADRNARRSEASSRQSPRSTISSHR